ncbi:MAG: aldo/keto reductase [Alphaproteobacteria bacterium]|nr:aldo/keto reductase [Alphaproteobacteria bacterium]
MKTRKLGNSELTVSIVGLGCNNFGMLDVAASRRVVDRAIDQGITLFDTADIYGNRGGSERQLGEILGPRRKDIVLATKFGMKMDDAGTKSGASRTYILQAVEDSLKRLKTDWIDLYQLHQPDPTTPIEETLEALNLLVRQGKVRAIGCSNMSAAQLNAARALSAAKGFAAFESAQDEYSLLKRDIEQGVLSAVEKYGMGLLPYFPLASGMLTGKYTRGAAAPGNTRFAVMTGLANRYMTDANWDKVETLSAFCKARGHTLLELAFSWLVSHQSVTSVIAGATRPEQIDQNVRAARWDLSSDELAEIDRITAG